MSIISEIYDDCRRAVHEPTPADPEFADKFLILTIISRAKNIVNEEKCFPVKGSMHLLFFDILDPAAASLVVAVAEQVPLVLNLFVQFQLGAGFGLGDAHLVAALEDVVHQDGVDAGIAVIRMHSHDEQIQGIVLHQALQDIDEAEGQHAAIALSWYSG